MALNQARIDFIKLHQQDVIDATRGTGIFPSVKMAQMIIESSNNMGVPGAGITATQANNYFGIKANSSWTGEKKAFNTPKDGQPVNYFRVYPTVKDSIVDHTVFLQHNPRYTTAGVFSAKSPADQLIALQKSGYSESPVYASSLAKIIKDYGLEELDKIQVAQTTTTEAVVETVKKKPLIAILVIAGMGVALIILLKNLKK
jgi:flagellum-specific peptidoglycan hydrolase FlgJ